MGVVVLNCFFSLPLQTLFLAKVYTHHHAQPLRFLAKFCVYIYINKSKHMVAGLMIWAVIGVLYILSKTDTAFKNIWTWVGTFLMVVFGILLLGFIGDSVKKWWKK